MIELLAETLFPGTEYIMLLTLLIPLAGALLLALPMRSSLRDFSAIAISALCFASTVNLAFAAFRRPIPEWHFAEPLPGLTLSFLLDPLGLLFALTSSALWLVTSIYAAGYLRANNIPHQERFHSFFALAMAAALGIAFSGNLLTLFLCYEILTLSTWPLVTQHGTAEARRGGRIYLGILLGSSMLLLLPAIIWTWHLAGTLDFNPGGILAGKASPGITGMLLLLYVYGTGKAALMPLHRWLPAAMVAPTPVSALLHAVAVVKAGVFTLLKIIVYIFGTGHLAASILQSWWAGGWLPYLAGFTVLAASVMALRQDNLKLRLAYSTISQLALIIMAASLLSSRAIMAGAFHIAAHACGKIALFLAAGAIATVTGKKYISEMAGIGRAMPWTMAAFSIGALSMIGIPPAAGFLTKYYMLGGAWQRGDFFAVAVLIIGTLLSAAYLLPVIFTAYSGKGMMERKEAPALMLAPLLAAALLTLALFLWPDIITQLAAKVQ